MTVTPSSPAPAFTGPRIEAAIIDLDGTMVDTADDFTAGLNGMLAQLDAAETSREEVVDYVGKGSEHLIRSVLAPRFEAEHAQDRFDEALAIYQEEYARINGTHTRLYPDVEAGLKAMHDAGLKLACVTNKPRRFAVQLLTQYGLIGYFSVVIGGDTLSKKKPDPLPMLTACAEMQVAPAATVAIGDSENDAMAGRAAGLATLTVPYGYNHGQSVQTIKSDGIVASLLDAAKAIAAHQSPTL
ncbi:phosphoglycolate phosphatase [Paraburkholderia sp. GAS334]|jgi:phosphoglycolate phosphatase|uniref:phosphoglycolate phosphatase n=1 Tax=unclassified Paraburkholderia TaxID=2615204 RepID=UPI003D1C9574